MPALHRDPKLDLLAEVPLFAHLSRRQLRQVARLLDVAEVEPGRVLTREGERGREFFVLLDGTARVEIGGVEVATVAAGDVVGEMALRDADRRSATVTAVTPLRLLVGDPRSFRALLEADADVHAAVVGTAVTRERANAA